QHLNEAPRPPSQVNPRVPQALNDLILMAMAKDPAGRFQTAEAFSKALRSVSTTATITAPMPAAPARTSPPQSVPVAPAAPPPVAVRKPNRTLWVVAGALAVVVVFAAALTFAPRFFKSTAGSKKEQPPAAQAAPTDTTAAKDQPVEPVAGAAVTPEPAATAPATDTAPPKTEEHAP